MAEAEHTVDSKFNCANAVLQASTSSSSSTSTAILDTQDANMSDGDLTSDITVKRGRMQAPIWSMFTVDSGPHLKKSGICRHCKETVTYHKKSELVQAHLSKCPAFKKLMMGTDIAERPQWFEAKKVKTANHKPQQQASITQYTLPPMSTKQKNEFQETIALHYYVTGTSFQRVEDNNFSKAIHMLRPDAVLPDRHKLGGPLLDKCYNT